MTDALKARIVEILEENLNRLAFRQSFDAIATRIAALAESGAAERTLFFVREVARGKLEKAKAAGTLLDGYEIARDALNRIVEILSAPNPSNSSNRRRSRAPRACLPAGARRHGTTRPRAPASSQSSASSPGS